MVRSLKPAPKKTNHTRGELHSRNPHRAPYDFPRLVAVCPELEDFLQAHPLGGDTIDFSNPTAVLTLNKALLKRHYGIVYWEIPDGALCPPVPSRADYLHHVADLAAEAAGLAHPVRVLDIGTGANAIYPLVGTAAFGWTFVGTDVDPTALASVRELVRRNPHLAGKIECRLQSCPRSIFKGITKPGETFTLSICNPPFHASREEAEAGTLRKLRNLGDGRTTNPVLNFGGRSNELWCEGGEAGFIIRMIRESRQNPTLCRWFTTLVSKQGNLPLLERALARTGAAEVRTLSMFAGQKQSRILAWRFDRDMDAKT